MNDNEASSSDESYDSDIGDDSEKAIETPKKEEMSMEQLLQMREKIGIKAFEKKFTERRKLLAEKKRRIEEKTKTSTKKEGKANSKNYDRKNKNRPQEMSSKRPVGKLRRNENLSSNKTRDPRFDELCGSKFNEEVFDARFSFLSDIRSKEKKVLTKKLQKTTEPEQKQKLKFLIQRMNNQEREKSRKHEEKEIVQKWRSEEKSKVVQGKRPFFLKDSEKKKLIQEHRKQKRSEKQKNTNRDRQGYSKNKRTVGHD